MTWQQLALAIIAIIVVVIVIILFRKGGEKGFGFAENIIEGLGEDKDKDGDGVRDTLDRCNVAPAPGQKVDDNGCIIITV